MTASSKIAEAFAEEQRASTYLAIKCRTAALVVIAILLCFLVSFPAVFYYHALILVFILSGLANLALMRSGLLRSWHPFVFIFADFALISFTLLYRNPFIETDLPHQFILRFGNFAYLFVLLTGLAFSYRPALVFWGGLAGALCWGAGVIWLLGLPDTITEYDLPGSTRGIALAFFEPTFIDIGIRVQEIVLFLIVAGLLGTVVVRSRRLVLRQASLERERSNLARYFPPATVDLLAGQDDPLADVREHEAAVLFADVVGFTAWAEDHQPRETIGLLRAVHLRLENAVFEHGGTLDKFIGDGMMATFGTPEPSDDDTQRALACIVAILAAFDEWNAERAARGRQPVRISLGLHYGPVVVGDIGSRRRLEFAVLGDTVNVASRLESLTRQLDCRAVVSSEVIGALPGGHPALDGFRDHGPVALKGRHDRVHVWTL